MTKWIWVALLPVVMLGSCELFQKKPQTVQDAIPEQDVRLVDCEVPVEAIFQDTIGLVEHSFAMYDDYAIEMANFPNGLALNLRQSGCRELQQRYAFTLPERIEMPQDSLEGPFWTRQLQAQFGYMGEYNDQFLAYSQMLAVASDFVTLGDTLQIFEDAAMVIDHFDAEAQTQLVVTFFIEP